MSVYACYTSHTSTSLLQLQIPSGLAKHLSSVRCFMPSHPCFATFSFVFPLFPLRDHALTRRSFSLNDNTLYRLTESLILHPIAAGLGFFAVVFGLLGILAASRLLTIIMAIFSFLGAVTTLVIFVIDMVIWNVLKNRIRGAGFTAQLVSVTGLSIPRFRPSLLRHVPESMFGS